MELVSNHPAVGEYVIQKTGVDCGRFNTIGVMDGNEVKAGVLYECWTGHNINMHCAAEPGSLWLTRKTLWTFFEYPFIQCGCRRVTGFVEASNLAARKLDEHLGFVEEARLKGAARDGGDVILYVMWKDQCRFLGERYGR